jgi:hypothetical protein
MIQKNNISGRKIFFASTQYPDGLKDIAEGVGSSSILIFTIMLMIIKKKTDAKPLSAGKPSPVRICLMILY